MESICSKLVDGDHNPPKGISIQTNYLMCSSTNINNDKLTNLEKVRYLTEEVFNKENERTRCKKGDILFTSVGSLGRSCIYEGDLNICFQRSVSVIATFIFNQYLKYFFDNPFFQNRVNKEATGTAQKGFYLNQLASSLIAIPPLNEQYRIVDKIKQLEPLIEKYNYAEIRLYELNSNIKQQLKKSILQYAIKGKLVPQDSNDEPASVLLDRIRKEKQKLISEGKIKKDKNESIIYSRDNSYYEKFDKSERCIDDEIPFEIPYSWMWNRWGNISFKIQYGYNARAKVKGKIKMVRISDIQDNKVIWENVPFCDIDDNEIEYYILHINDILFARTGGTVGKSFLVDNIEKNAVFAGYLIRTVYDYINLNPKYLKYYMETNLYWSQLRKGTIATAQPNCNGQTLSSMFIPIPPLEEQKRIIEKINKITNLLEL